MKFKFAALVALCFLSVAASRPMLRGYPIGKVTAVNQPAGIISVDLGSRDFVLKGFPFSIVDGEGRQVAKVIADEVYRDVFWSGKLAQAEFGKIRPGFQARWLFTPEIKAVADALKRNEAGSYKDLIERLRRLPVVHNGMQALESDAPSYDYDDSWPDSMIELIEMSVHPTRWVDAGGQGSISPEEGRIARPAPAPEPAFAFRMEDSSAAARSTCPVATIPRPASRSGRSHPGSRRSGSAGSGSPEPQSPSGFHCPLSSCHRRSMPGWPIM